jgi:uncharacterized membrane protein YfcA
MPWSGWGLIQIPLLFSAFPQAAPATLFGTNKLASVFGTAGAAVQYSRRVSIPWCAAGPAALAAAIGSWSGHGPWCSSLRLPCVR